MQTTRYRTHTCGELRKTDVGRETKIAGWVHSYRDYGKLVFIDLRDREGLTQLVFNADTCSPAILEDARKLRSEWVVSASGKVEARETKLINPKLATGEIEVHVTQLTVLSSSPTPRLRRTNMKPSMKKNDWPIGIWIFAGLRCN